MVHAARPWTVAPMAPKIPRRAHLRDAAESKSRARTGRERLPVGALHARGAGRRGHRGSRWVARRFKPAPENREARGRSTSTRRTLGRAIGRGDPGAQRARLHRLAGAEDAVSHIWHRATCPPFTPGRRRLSSAHCPLGKVGPGPSSQTSSASGAKARHQHSGGLLVGLVALLLAAGFIGWAIGQGGGTSDDHCRRFGLGSIDPHVAAGAHDFVQFGCAQCHGELGEEGLAVGASAHRGWRHTHLSPAPAHHQPRARGVGEPDHALHARVG